MKFLNTLMILIVFAALSGCGSPMKSFTNNSNGWRPIDFAPGNGVLLVEKVQWPKGQQKKMERFMAKSYPYKYEFIDRKDLDVSSKKYSDVNLYRFAIVSSYSSHTMHQNDMSQHPVNVSAFDFHFIDRTNNKEYPQSGIASSWASKTFIKIIETLLKNPS